MFLQFLHVKVLVAQGMSCKSDVRIVRKAYYKMYLDFDHQVAACRVRADLLDRFAQLGTTECRCYGISPSGVGGHPMLELCNKAMSLVFR